MRDIDFNSPVTGKQDAFDRNWRWFIVDRNPPGIGGDGFCTYRGEKGCRCGVGLLVLDDDIARRMRGMVGSVLNETVDDDPHGEPTRQAKYMLGLAERVDDASGEGDEFLARLQMAHDKAVDQQEERGLDFYAEYEQRLRELAEGYHLVIPDGPAPVAAADPQ